MKKKNDKKTVVNGIKAHVKGISALVVGYGVGEIMGSILKEYDPEAKGIKKLVIKLGAIALTGMVVKSVTDYVDGEIDDIFDTATAMVEEIEALTDDNEEE